MIIARFCLTILYIHIIFALRTGWKNVFCSCTNRKLNFGTEKNLGQNSLQELGKGPHGNLNMLGEHHMNLL